MSGSLDLRKIDDAWQIGIESEGTGFDAIIAEIGRQLAEKLLAWPPDSSLPVGVAVSLVREWTGAE